MKLTETWTSEQIKTLVKKGRCPNDHYSISVGLDRKCKYCKALETFLLKKRKI